MEEILKLMDEMSANFKKDDPALLKIQLAKSTTIAGDEIAKLLKRQDFDGAMDRIKSLYDEHIKIRAAFVVSQFPSGGVSGSGI